MGCITVDLYPLRKYLSAAPRLSEQRGAIRSHQVSAIVPWYFSLSADPRYFTNTSRAPCIALVLFVLGPFRPFQVSLLLQPKKPINVGADACFAQHQNLECIISSPRYVRAIVRRHRLHFCCLSHPATASVVLPLPCNGQASTNENTDHGSKHRSVPVPISITQHTLNFMKFHD